MLAVPYATPVNLLRARAHRTVMWDILRAEASLPLRERAWSHQIEDFGIPLGEIILRAFRNPVMALSAGCAALFLLLSVLWVDAYWLVTRDSVLAMGEAEQRRSALPPAPAEPLRLAMLHRIPAQPDPFVGVYLTVASMEREGFRSTVLDELQAAGGDALIFEAKGRKAYFRTGASIAVEYDLTDPYSGLAEVIEDARRRGMTVIARYVAVRDFLLPQAIPETRIPIKGTNGSLDFDWVNPAHPTVLAFHRELIADLLQYDIDEILFDYIRYPTEFTPAATGQTGEDRIESIEAFLRMTRDTIDAVRPETRLGISTFAILGWSYDDNAGILGQDVVRFAPLVDVIAPMAYPISFDVSSYYDPAKHGPTRDYGLVYGTLRGYAERLGPLHARKLRPWIQGYGLTTKQMAEEMKGVYGAGVCGFMVWNAQNLYAQAFEAMRLAGERPGHCRSEEN